MERKGSNSHRSSSFVSKSNGTAEKQKEVTCFMSKPNCVHLILLYEKFKNSSMANISSSNSAFQNWNKSCREDRLTGETEGITQKKTVLCTFHITADILYVL